MKISSFLFHIVAAALFSLSLCAIVQKKSLQDASRVVGSHDTYKYSISATTFESSENSNSTVYISLSPNDRLGTSYENPIVESSYLFVKGDLILIHNDNVFVADSTLGVWIFDISDPHHPKYRSFVARNYEKEEIKSLYVAGDLLFLAEDERGMTIHDISDISNPIFQSRYREKLHGNYAYTLDVIASEDGKMAVMCDKHDGFKILNISDPKTPQLISAFKTSSYSDFCYGLISFDDELVYYQGGGSQYLRVVNITDLRNPIEIELFSNSLSTGSSPQGAKIIEQNGGRKYMVTSGKVYGSYFRVMDVTLPIPNTTDKDGWVIDSSHGVKIEDSSASLAVHVHQQVAYVADAKYGIKSVDIRNTTNLRVLDTLKFENCFGECVASSISIDQSRDLVMMAMKFGGFVTVNISNPNNMSILYEFMEEKGPGNCLVGVGNEAQAVIVDSKYLYVGEYDRVRIFEVAEDKTQMRLVTKEMPDGFGYCINTIIMSPDSQLIFIYYASGIQVLNISDPVRPKLSPSKVSGFVYCGSHVKAIKLFEGKYVFSFMSAKIQVYDINDFFNASVPSVPALNSFELTSYKDSVLSYMNSISVTNDFRDESCYLYAVSADYFTFFILKFSCSNVTAPFEILSKFYIFRPTDVIVDEENGIAFIACDTDGLKILDISNKTNPVILSTYDTVMSHSMVRYEDTIFITNFNGPTDCSSCGIDIVDISDVDKPYLLGHLKMSSPVDIFVKDNYIYVADMVHGFKSIRMDVNIRSLPTTFPSFCGHTTINVIAKDLIGDTLEIPITIIKESYCENDGICRAGYECDCVGGYEGKFCETWSCGGGLYTNPDETCNGNGICRGPGSCDCYGGYSGDLCDYEYLTIAILVPTLSVIGISVFTCFLILSCCCCCCICGICCIFGLIGLVSSGAVIFRLYLNVSRYRKLKNFDLLMKEQELEEDESVAHLKFNKKLFEIDYNDIRVLSILGEGGSASVVYKANWKGKMAAFKCFKTRSLVGGDSFDEFEREVSVMSSISHPNIVRFFGACLNPPRVGILMEFCAKGELLAFVLRFRKTNMGIAYPIYEKIRLLFEVSAALEFLHSRNIIHRDLKVENVLISESEHCKLMDFGLSRLIRDMNSVKTERIGTQHYMAPEIINGKGIYDNKVDIFSFAILCYVVLCEVDNPYFKSVHTVHGVEFIVANDPNFRPDMENLKHCLGSPGLDWLAGLVEHCWNHDPSERYSCQQIREILEQKMEEPEKSIEVKEEERSEKKEENEDEEEKGRLRAEIEDLKRKLIELGDKN